MADLERWAATAERVGFESLWVAEYYDRSATVPLAVLARQTSRLTLGSGIAYAFGRQPLVLAAEARDIDSLSAGRLILGLGTGTLTMMRDWHGLEGNHPAPRIEELVPLLRRLWQLHASPVEHDGRFYRTVVSPTNDVRLPEREMIPTYIAGVNERMLSAAGRVADGLVGHPLFSPEYVAEVVRPALAKGAEDVGRASPVPIAGYVICAIDNDNPAHARRLAAGQIALYAVTRTYAPMLERSGFGEETANVRAAWDRSDRAAMIEAVSDRMIDALALAGTESDVRARYAQRWEGVYERVLFYPPTFGGSSDPEAVLEAFAQNS
jgi:probable F420-dependent oxidoreductase